MPVSRITIDRVRLGLWLLSMPDRNVPFVTLHFFYEGEDIRVLGVNTRDQTAQRTTDCSQTFKASTSSIAGLLEQEANDNNMMRAFFL